MKTHTKGVCFFIIVCYPVNVIFMLLQVGGKAYDSLPLLHNRFDTDLRKTLMVTWLSVVKDSCEKHALHSTAIRNTRSKDA